MSKAFQFPQDPNRPNPFADPGAPPPAPGDNPYSSSQVESVVPPSSITSYDALPHRGLQLLIFGVLGVGIVVCSLPFTYFCVPFGALIAILNFGLTIPAWQMGRYDLKAMKVGALDRRGESLTFAGWLLGIIGTLGNFGAIGLTIARLLFFSPD